MTTTTLTNIGSTELVVQPTYDSTVVMPNSPAVPTLVEGEDTHINQANQVVQDVKRVA